MIKYILDFGFGKLEELYGCFNLTNYVLNQDLIKEHYHFSTYTFKRFRTKGAGSRPGEVS